MDLEDFIRTTLVSIVRGVVKANRDIPSTFFLRQGTGDHHDKATVDFDVAVTTSREAAGAGKAGFRIHIAEASLGGERRATDEEISRLKFSVAFNRGITDTHLPDDPTPNPTI